MCRLCLFLGVFYAMINAFRKPVWTGVGVASKRGQIGNEPINDWQKSRRKTDRELDTGPSFYSTWQLAKIALLRQSQWVVSFNKRKVTSENKGMQTISGL